MRAPAASTDSLKLLAAGRADFSVVDIHDLGLARERGQDVVGVGAIVQRPLAAVIARAGVRRPRDLEGRRVGVTGLPSDDAVLESVVRADGGDPAQGAHHHDRLLRGAQPGRGQGRRRGHVLERRGRGAEAARRAHARVPRGPIRRAALPRAGAGHHARDAASRTRSWCAHVVAALRAGTRAAAADLPAASAAVARRAQGDRALTDAQLRAVAPAFEPPLRAAPPRAGGLGRFDARFGILERPPDVDRAFAFDRDAGLSPAAAARPPARPSRAPCASAAPPGEKPAASARRRVSTSTWE